MVVQGPHKWRLKTSYEKKRKRRSKKATILTTLYLESIFWCLGGKIIKITINTKYTIDYG